MTIVGLFQSLMTYIRDVYRMVTCQKDDDDQATELTCEMQIDATASQGSLVRQQSHGRRLRVYIIVARFAVIGTVIREECESFLETWHFLFVWSSANKYILILMTMSVKFTWFTCKW